MYTLYYVVHSKNNCVCKVVANFFSKKSKKQTYQYEIGAEWILSKQLIKRLAVF